MPSASPACLRNAWHAKWKKSASVQKGASFSPARQLQLLLRHGTWWWMLHPQNLLWCFKNAFSLRRFLFLWTMVAPRGDVGMTRRDSLWLQLYYCHVRHNAKERRDPKRFSNYFRLCKSSRSGTDLGEQKSCGNGNCWAKLGLYRPVEWQWVPSLHEHLCRASYRSAIAAKFLQLPLRNGVLLSGVLSRDPPKAGVGESCGCKEYSLDSWYTDIQS